MLMKYWLMMTMNIKEKQRVIQKVKVEVVTMIVMMMEMTTMKMTLKH